VKGNIMEYKHVTSEQFNLVNGRMYDLIQELLLLGKEIEVFNVHPDHAENIFVAARILSKVRYAMSAESF
jgi:hypothetical protein